MITISFNGTDKRVQATIQSGGTQLRASLAKTMDRLMLELQARIQHKLMGEVLEHKSGKLLGSVIKLPVEVEPQRIVGRVTAAGGPAFYGRIQEKGGLRTYEIKPVNKKALAFFPRGSLGGGGGFAQVKKSIIHNLFEKSGAGRGSLRRTPQAQGKFSAYGGLVVMKVTHPPLQPRPFMAPSLEEMRGRIIEQIRETILNTIKK